MKNKTAAVIGGGNSGFDAVTDLLSYASKIYLLEFSDTLKGDPLTLEKLKGVGEIRNHNNGERQRNHRRQLCQRS